MSEYLQRFAGIQRLYGQHAFNQLHKKHVAVIGVGGVGSWAAEALVRSGIGTLTLIDLDDICISNTNRQLHTLTSTIGQSKIEALKARFLDINPDCDIHVIDDFIDEQNVTAYLRDTLDGVIDAIDSAKLKAAIIHHCKRNKINIITTGAAGGQIDPTKITIKDISRTENDPLIAKVRKHLRYDYGYSKNPKKHFSVPCVFSMEQMRYPQPDGEVCETKQAMDDGVRLDCSGGFGASTMVTASFGLFAAARLVDKLVTTQTNQQMLPIA